MLRFLQFVWSIAALGGVALFWWFMYGPWKSAGPDMINRDLIRFARLPVTLAFAWIALVLGATLLTLARPTKRELTRRSTER